MIDNIDIYTAGAIIGTASVVVIAATSKYFKYKQLFNQSLDVLISVRDALDDDKITKDEVKQVIDESQELFDEIKNIFKR